MDEVKIVSYQGSASSTSDGVLQVFQKARDYVESSREVKATVVVLIDEVGLAEISPSNPLKVLHSLLEHSDFESKTEVAVVGISNWSLDAAKMNRAIHISRPEPDLDQLLETAKAIFDSYQTNGGFFSSGTKSLLKGVSIAYSKFYQNQLISANASFHGLRDFYSTIKVIAKNQATIGLDPKTIAIAVARNFGGLENSMEAMQERLMMELRDHIRLPVSEPFMHVKELVKKSLMDRGSRHLMLLTSGKAVLNALDGLFKDCGLPSPRIMIGSNLKGDQCESYYYQVLSQIIECFQIGTPLVLQGLDGVYGSLYDLLNQAYTPIGSKNYCRVALGKYSAPMCYVHDHFKCVVIVESVQAPNLDPPFLNRFEKQLLPFSALLTPRDQVTLRKIEQWVMSASSIRGASKSTGINQKKFGPKDLFVGCSSAALQSLVSLAPDGSEVVALSFCKKMLLRLATCSGVVRLLSSEWARHNQDKAKSLCKGFFHEGTRSNLQRLLERHLLCREDILSESGGAGEAMDIEEPSRESDSELEKLINARPSTKLFVTTFSNISFFQPENHLPQGLAHSCRKLASFDTERSLADFVRKFYQSITKGQQRELLLLECDASFDSSNILLAKFLVDREEDQYARAGGSITSKAVVFLINVANHDDWDICFSKDWDYFHLEDLKLSGDEWQRLSGYLDKDLHGVLEEDGLIEQVISSELMACFRHIRYGKVLGLDQHGTTSLADRIIHICTKVSHDCHLKKKIKTKLLPYIEREPGGNHFVLCVALNRERLELSSLSLSYSVDAFIREVVRAPLMKLVFLLEKHSSFDFLLDCKLGDMLQQSYMFLEYGKATEEFAWSLFDSPLLDINSVRSLIAGGTYDIEELVCGLRFPFSKLLSDSLEDLKRYFLQDVYGLGQGGRSFIIGKGECDKMVEDRFQGACEDDFLLSTLRVKYSGLVSDKLMAFLAPDDSASSSTDLLVEVGYIDDVIILYSSALCRSGPAVIPMVSLLKMVLEALGMLRDPAAVHVLLWENNEVLAALLDLMELVPQEILEGILADLYMEPRPDLRRLGYALACAVCRHAVDLCCISCAKPNLWVYDLEEKLCRVQDVCSLLGIPFDRSMGLIDVEMALLDTFYIGKVLLDLARKSSCSLTLLDGRENHNLGMMNAAFLADCTDWLIRLGQVSMMSEKEERESKGVAMRIIEKFLYVTCEVAFKMTVDDMQEDSTFEAEAFKSYLRSPVFVQACRNISSLKDEPPVEVTTVLHLILMEVWKALASMDNGPYPYTFVVTGRAILKDELAPLTDIQGTRLEILILDLIRDNYMLDSEEGNVVGDDCVKLFEAAFRNVALDTQGPMAVASPGLLVRWYSHVLVDRFLSTAALRLDNGTLSCAWADGLNRNLGIPEKTPQVEVAVNALRMQFLKRLGTSIEELSTRRYREVCPWLSNYFDKPPEKKVLGFNPFLKTQCYLLHRNHCYDAWDDLHDSFLHSKEKLVELLDRILTLEDGDGSVTDLPLALTMVGFMKVFSQDPRKFEVRKEAKIQAQRLCQGTLPKELKAIGKFFIGVCNGLKTLADEWQDQASPEDTNSIVSENVFMASLCLGMMGLATLSPSSFFGRLIFSPQVFVNSFLVGAESNLEGIVMRASGTTLTRYMCRCGYVYFVDGCGQVTHDSDCPSCHSKIGGPAHGVPHSGQQRIDHVPHTGENLGDEPGYFFSAEHVRDVNHSEREMSPAEYHILVFLVHAALATGVIVQDDEGQRRHHPLVKADSLGGNAANFLEYFWRITRSSWKALVGTLLPHGNEDMLCALLHDLLHVLMTSEELNFVPTSSLERLNWERIFSAKCKSFLKEPLERATESMDSFMEQQMSGLEKDLRELRPPPPSKACLQFYRLVEQPTIANVRASYYSEVENRERYPLIHLMFEHEPQLKILSCLLPIVRWTNALRKSKNLQLSREEARQTHHSSLWRRGRGHLEEGLTAKDFQIYMNAWNTLRRDFRDGCKEILLWELREDAPLLLSCLQMKDEGRVVAAVINRLGSFQNAFLEACLQTKAMARKAYFNRARLIGIQAVKQSDIVTLDPTLWEDLRSYSRAKLGFGQGFDVEYDFEGIEKLVVAKLLRHKTLLQISIEDMEPLRYRDETFSTDNQILTLIAQRIPQEPMPDIETFKADKYVQDAKEVTNRILPAVEALMYMMVTLKLEVKSAMKLMDFASSWLDDSNKQQFKFLKDSACEAFSSLMLRHVESLYEVLEDTVCETLLENISLEKFGVELESTDVDGIWKIIDYVGGVQAFESSWRRFIVRYLREPLPLDPAHGLSYFISLVRFPHGVDIEEQPELMEYCAALTVGQSLSILSLVRSAIKSEGGKGGHGGSAAQGAPGSSADAKKRIEQQARPAANEGLAAVAAPSSSMSMKKRKFPASSRSHRPPGI